MSHFTIEMLSDQCGVSMPNLRAWQRYGLLKPIRDAAGKRYFDYNHLLRIQLIIKWLNQGVALSEIARLFKGEHVTPGCQWEFYQESLLTALEKPQSEKLRACLRRLGRELPAGSLIDNIVQPLRLWLREEQCPVQTTRRVRFDTQLLEYTTFVLQSMRKRPAPTLIVIPLNMQDPLAVWLEALRYSGEGFRIDLLHEAVAQPDLKLFDAEHYLLYSDLALTPPQQVMLRQWQNEGIPLFFAGAGFCLSKSNIASPVNEADRLSEVSPLQR